MPRQKLKESLPDPLPAAGYATIAQAGTFLSLSRATIYTLMDGGELAYARFGRARRIAWQELRRFADACTVAAG